MKKFHTHTLGCKVNQYETRSIAEAWTGTGQGEETSEPEKADLILVNSCAVTANAVADLRQAVRKLNRVNPEAEIVITGCAAQTMPEELMELPGVVRVVPQDQKSGLLGGFTGQTEPFHKKFQPFAIDGYHRARPVLKVQDGCSHHCTYCIVPLTRGPSVSRPMEDILDEARRLLQGGFRELILSGVNLRHFGRDLEGKPDFWDLIQRLEAEFGEQWSGKARLRISSVEPGQLTDKALATLGNSNMVCPQLHLSLQSGDPDVLKAMGRGHYDPNQALEFTKRIREFWPVFGLGADIIAGFPGESDEQFANTLEFCRKLPLTYAHVFPYSPRPGTRAAEMDGQLDMATKKGRAKKLRTLIAEKKKHFLELLLKQPHLDVLVQDERGNGVSQYYAACRVMNAQGATRRILRCRPVSLEKGKILVSDD